MTVQELVAHFPEIPADLHVEPLLTEFADAFDDPLRAAQKPSACSKEHTVGNQYYLKLIGPMDIYRYGLFARERVLEDLGKLLAAYREAPEACLENLAPAGNAE
ncbi:MAG: hypothetical protein O2954_07050 [bacterium]|nr:hypothetical protein [bacterium]